MIRSRGFARLLGIILSWSFLIALTCLTLAPGPAQSSNPGIQLDGIPVVSGHDESQPLSAKQRLSIMRANLEKSQNDAAELAALAKGLRDVLNEPNVNVPSLEVINRADKIEKLARKIREETKGPAFIGPQPSDWK